MRLALQIGGLLLACAATGLTADQRSSANSAAPASPPVRPAPVQPAPAPRPVPKAGIPRQPKLGPPLSNPGSLAARLYRATPEERDRALEKLPLKMQELLRKQLADFDRMPKEQQQVWIRRAERFAALSPERKAQINGQLQALVKLPADRRREIGIALRRLIAVPEEDRRRILSSDEFKSRFSADEQKMIADLADVML
jgi:hypothetical protein